MSADSGPGRREVAQRLFAAEFDDADLSYSESDEERAPNYVVTPTGARINRLFAVGVLTEVEDVSEDVLRARVVDPSGAFVAYAGQYQPDEMAFLERTTTPAFLAVTGKARTFEPEDSDRVYTSVRPESINEVDADTRDRWVVSTAETTLRRVAVMRDALATDARGDELTERLEARGASPALAAGVTRALDHYGTTPAYLEAVRRLAVDALEVVTGEREEVRSLDVAPDEDGDVEPGPLPESPLADADATETASDESGGETGRADPETAESELAAVPDTESATAGKESGATADPDPEVGGGASASGTGADADAESGIDADADAGAATAGGGEADATADPDPDSEAESGDGGVAAEPSDETDAEPVEGATEPTAAERESTAPEPEAVEAGAGPESEADEADPGELGDFDVEEPTAADAGESGTGEPPFGEAGATGSASEETVGSAGATEATGPAVETTAGGDEAESVAAEGESDREGSPGADEPELYELDDEERREVESQFDTDFSTGNEVSDPGETGIETPGADEARQADAGAEPTPTDPAGDDAASGEAATPDADADADVDLETAAVELMEELGDGDGADRDRIVAALVDRRGADPGDAEDAIRDALMSGRCYEAGEGTLKPI